MERILEDPLNALPGVGGDEREQGVARVAQDVGPQLRRQECAVVIVEDAV